jgi:multidrug efflux pump
VNISEGFIRRPVATGLLMLALVLLGCLGYKMLPVSALPMVDFPTIEVRADYPGASPEVMASSVTTPLERQFGQISGLSSMTSTSSFAHSSLTLQFELGRDIDSAAQDVQAAINTAAGVLPRAMPSPPTFNKVNPADPPILTLVVESDTLPLAKINDFADTVLSQKLSQVYGVGLVSIQGNQKPAIRVRINPSALAKLDLSLEDVRAAVTSSNLNAPKGSFDGKRQSYAISTNDQIITPEGFQSLIIAYKNGSPVRISDVGEVVDGVENNRQGAWVNGKSAVLVDVQRQPSANIIETADRIKDLLPLIKASQPPSIRISIFADRTETIRASVRDVEFTLLATVGLVVMVIFVFLRKVWATVIPSIAVPLAIVGTFGVMKLGEYSLDNLSLMALTICTGFVVDDAIVMIENIVRFIEAGETPFEAALKGARQIGFTVVSLSLSLIAVFIPLLFMTGIVGRLFREFAIVLSIAVILSAIVSLTLTPMMCARLLRPESESAHGALFRTTERWFETLRDWYDAGLKWVLRHEAFTLLVTLATVAATVWLYIIVPKGLLPLQDTGLILGVTDAEQTISFKTMSQRQAEVAAAVSKDPDVKSVASFVGTGAVNATLNTGRLYINLKPRNERSASAQKIIDRLRIAVQDVEGISLFMQAVQDVQIDSRPSRTQYQLTLQDPDEDELELWALKLKEELAKSSVLADVASDQQSGGLQLKIDIDRDKASRFNVRTQAIDDTLYDAFGQRQVSSIFTQLNQYRVVLEVLPAFQIGPDALEKIHVKSSTGQLVPIDNFASVRTVAAPLAIHHQGQFSCATLSFNLAPNHSLSQAVAEIESAKRRIGLPPSVATQYVGSAAEFNASLRSAPLLLLAAIVVIYIVLGILYESYIHPITILSSLPSAGVGALVALILAKMDLSLIALIGIILLIGIVKKNAIMMIDFALEAERDTGLEPRESIYQACLLRFRPILMTTMAALLGALPLALEDGTGSELRKPLGVTIIGGLIFSQFLTLYTTPVIYLTLDRFSKRLTRFFRKVA